MGFMGGASAEVLFSPMSNYIVNNELTDLHRHFKDVKARSAILPNITSGLNQIQEGAIRTLVELGGRVPASKLIGSIYGQFAPKMKPEAIYEECLNMSREWVMHYPLLSCGGCGSPFEANFPPPWENYFELTEVGTLMADIAAGGAPEFPHLFVNGHFGAASAIPPHPLENVALAVSAIVSGSGADDEAVSQILGFPDFASGCVIGAESDSIEHLTKTKKAGVFQQVDIAVADSDEGYIMDITRFPPGKTPQGLIDFILEREGDIRGLRKITNETAASGGAVRIKMAPTSDPDELQRLILQEFKGQQQFKCKMLVRNKDGSLAVQPYIALLREYVVARIEWLTTGQGLAANEAASTLVSQLAAIAKRRKKKPACLPKSLFNAAAAAPTHPMVVILTTNGMIRRVSAKSWQPQDRGGRGVESVSSRPGSSSQDGISHVAYGAANHYLLLMSSKGNVHFRQIADLSEGQRDSIGEPVSSLLGFHEGESITAVCVAAQINPNDALLIATARGLAKRVSMEQYASAKKAGRAAIKLNDGDFVSGMSIISMGEDAIFVSKASRVIRVRGEMINPSGPATKGSKIMALDEDDLIAGCCAGSNDEQRLLTVTEGGNGKFTLLGEFKHQEPGTEGSYAMKAGDMATQVACCALSRGEDDVYIASSSGRLILFATSEIATTGKCGIGVAAMKMISVGDRVADLSLVRKPPAGATSEKVETLVSDVSDDMGDAPVA